MRLGLGLNLGLRRGASAITTPDVSPSLDRLYVHIDADIDTEGERDDHSAMALWLADQDNFNLIGLTASAPDSNAAAFNEVITAYASDRDKLVETATDAANYKTEAELDALVVQGSTVDAPSKGYWESGDSGYAAPHAAAQAMLTSATNGDPNSDDPTRKVWIIVQGGFTTLAQAAYEAIELGQMPDFWRRIRVIGQPNYNSWWAPNSWGYLFDNIWPSAGTPGMFGDAWMLCGYLQWHAFNRDNGTTDETFWNNITANSAMGTHLELTRTRGTASFSNPHFRAGDAGTWFWLQSAKARGDYDPTNAGNACGVYRTYEGETWAAQTFGYGSAVKPETPNPEGVTYSTTMFAPELTVDSFTDAYSAVDLSGWYSTVEALMERYQEAPAPIAAGIVGEWDFTSATSPVSDISGNGLDAAWSTADSSDPGLDGTIPFLFFDNNDRAILGGSAAATAFNDVLDGALLIAIVRADDFTGDRIFWARDNGGSDGHWQFRFQGGRLQFLDRRSSQGATVTVEESGTSSVDTWYLVSAHVAEDGTMTLRKNGSVVGTATTTNGQTSAQSEMTFGVRQSSNYGDGFRGWIGYACLYSSFDLADIDTAEQRAFDAVASGGVTIPGFTAS